MFRSVLLLYFFRLVLNEESVLETVQGGVGESVVFQCNSGTKTLKTITAHWRYNDYLNVYDIENGKALVADQEPVYKNRAEISPQYKKGDFSLTLQRLQHSDTGIYCCFINELSSLQCTKLQVKEKVIESQEKPSSDREDQSKSERISPLFISFFFVTLLLLCQW